MIIDKDAHYKKITMLFDDLELHGGTRESVIEKPYHYEDQGDEIYINEQDMLKLTDGKQIEMCRWRIDEPKLWDISAEKECFDSQAEREEYLRCLNFPLENTVDIWNEKWAYMGEIQKDDVWRVQYFFEEEYDD